MSPLEFEITRVDCKYQKIHFLILRGLYFLTATVIRAKSCTNTFSGPVWFQSGSVISDNNPILVPRHVQDRCAVAVTQVASVQQVSINK